MKKGTLFKQLVSSAVIGIMLLSNVRFSTDVFAQSKGISKLTFAKLNPGFIEYINSNGRNKYSKIPSPITIRKSLTTYKAAKQTSLPSKYDLRDVNGNNYVTPVKNQGAINSCWAFAAMAALESNLLYTRNEGHDFSENNLITHSGFDFTPMDGGSRDMSAAYFARWSGPVNEQSDPYPALGEPQDIVTRNGLGSTEHIQNIIYIPARTSYTDNTDFKNAVMAYGAVDTAMYVDPAGLSAYDSYYNTLTSAFCYYTGKAGQDDIANHEISIVGWDDTYSRNNFKTVPPGDGAFICKNSWGTGFGQNGYFYISYYDAVIGGEGTVYLSDSTDNYDNIYQYDKLGVEDQIGDGSNTAYFANVFSPKGSESLKAVSFYTTKENASYSIGVETNYDQNKLTKLAIVKTGTIAMPGYHTINLDNSVRLSGNKFAVAVKLTEPGEPYPVCVEYPIPGYSGGATASAGQSYISTDGTSWDDITSVNADTNVCLKAFTDNNAPDSFTRLYGSDRYATSVEVAKQGWSNSDNVVLASGELFPDALCAVPVAKALNAPVLLTKAAYLPSVVSDEIKALGAKNIIIMGGTGAVSGSVQKQLTDSGYTCSRIAGADRYGTSVEAAKYLRDHFGSNGKVVLATGQGFADALSIASYAGSQKIPIILTTRYSMPSAVSGYISSSNITKAYIIGGTGVIDNKIYQVLQSAGRNPERLGGQDRYDTNAIIINNFGSTFNFNTVFFASGTNFPDALSGSAMAAVSCSPVILNSNTSKQSQSTVNLIKNYEDKIKTEYLLGGDSVLHSDYINALFQ